MKNCYNLNLIKRMALVVLLGMVVFGCAPKEPPQLKAVVSKLEVTLEESPSVDTACAAKDMDTIVDKGVPMMSKGKKGGQSPQETGSEEDSEQYAAMLEEIRKQLNFTTLHYHRLDDMIEGLGIEPCKLCTYCWNGQG